MAPPCVYSEGSYWVTADICSGDGGGGVGSERCGEEKRGGGQGEGGGEKERGESPPLRAQKVILYLNEKL